MKASRLSILLLLLIGCHKDDAGSPNIAYLNEIIDVMQAHSINRKTIDWNKFRSDAITAAGDGATDDELYNGIQNALTALGDHHSRYTRGTKVILAPHPVCTGSSTTVGTLDNIGYILVPGYDGTDNQLAIDLQNKIKAQDKAALEGWIVDLRGNLGGNMYPMLAGVGPILGEGIAGYFIDPDNVTESFSYSSGKALINETIVTQVPSYYTLISPNPKVAVLTDIRTTSAGEAIAIAFTGRPNTRFFGTATCGLSTANEGHALSDGASLVITGAVDADRNMNKKGGPLIPDETIAGDTEVVTRAIAWLNEN